jgi:hypothetical protein
MRKKKIVAARYYSYATLPTTYGARFLPGHPSTYGKTFVLSRLALFTTFFCIDCLFILRLEEPFPSSVSSLAISLHGSR